MSIYPSMSIKELEGKIIKDIRVVDSKEIVFETIGGNTYRMQHEQDCCECVVIEDICGDMRDLIGVPIVQAFERTSSKDDERPLIECYKQKAIDRLLNKPMPDYNDESFTWTFYTIATIKGTVTIRWYGSSNGYYSESVNFEEVY